MPGLLCSELCHQSLKRVAQMPLAQVQLGVGEASTNGVRKAVVVVAHNPRRRAGKRAEERLPVGLRLACEHLQAPQLRPPALIAHRREDPNAIRVRPVSGSRTRNGRWSSSNDPLVGQARGR
jgi:hypothetical protein